MSRLYRLRIEVTCREDTPAERAAVQDAASQHFPGAPEEWDYPEDGKTVLAFEGERSLGGGASEREAHDHIRSTLGGRPMWTKWWYLEGAPDEEFYDSGDGEE